MSSGQRKSIDEILMDHESRLSRIEAYLKVIAAEATILIPIVVAILFTGR